MQIPRYSYLLHMSGAIVASAVGFLAAGLLAGWLRRRRRRSMQQANSSNACELIVEITLSDIESAEAACKGGANSIELCADLAAGGVTPSIGLVEAAVCALGSFAKIHVLVRPRPGDFCYSDQEFEVILRDIATAKEAGADGVVVGVLTSEGTVDKLRMEAIRKAATGMQLTFHRAFDVAADPDSAFADLLAVGCDRLLTSGCANSAVEGQTTLQRLVQTAEDRIAIVAAAGLSASNVASIVEFAKVHGVHAGTAVTRWKNVDTAHEQTFVSMANSDRGRVDTFARVEASLVRDFATTARAAFARCHNRADEDAKAHVEK